MRPLEGEGEGSADLDLTISNRLLGRGGGRGDWGIL